MKNKVFNLLKGSFLISEDAPAYWRFIIYLFLLAVVMIYASHRADSKVHQIAALHTEVNALKGKFVVLRSKVQHIKLESNIKEKVSEIDLHPPVSPPEKIVVTRSK